ncbi:RNA-directed DNA polymerase from mobile element jockey [Eumeta japonica]|uniref:RNA-directed DNA polymerase from mobile element jockey n=1 Tax=Eumeta variegata TaxID=151549 RepID=A0A4C1VRQ1_EUMVA|nr:RNA-directed DNA polymerase from mobile element jockey [Eumeta japonica]
MSSESCVQLLKEKLSEFNISLDNDIVGISTDGASVMKKVGCLIEPLQQLCYAHGVQLNMTDVIYKKNVESKAGEKFKDSELNTNRSAEEEVLDDNPDNYHGILLPRTICFKIIFSKSLAKQFSWFLTARDVLLLHKLIQEELEETLQVSKSPFPRVSTSLDKLESFIKKGMDLLECGGTRGRFSQFAYNCLVTLLPTSVELKRAFSAAGPDILDIALMKRVALKLSCIQPLQWLNSDHRPVLMRCPYQPHQDSSPKYPTCENKSHAHALQRKVKARMREVRNENWSDLMSEISLSYQAYWGLVKALKTEGAVPTPALRKPDKFIAFDDREKARCLADSIGHQCSENPPYDLEHVRRVEEEVRHRVSLPPKDDLDPITHDETRQYVLVNETCRSWSTAVRSTLHGSTLSPLLYSAYVNDIPRLSKGVQIALFADDTALYLRSNNIGNILSRLQRSIDELTQWLRLWRIDVTLEKSASIYFNYSTHKVQFPVPYDTPHLKVLSKSIPWQHNYKYLGITIDKHLHFTDHITRVRKLALFYLSRLYGMIGRKSKMSLRNKRTTYTMCIRPVMTYASPVIAHAGPDRLYDLQIVQHKFCRIAADAPWYVKISVLHRDLELPTISKYMKDASERFFDVASSHPNPLLATSSTSLLQKTTECPIRPA